MERALVVVEPTDSLDELVGEAGTLAAGVGAELVLLHVTTESEYEQDRKAMENVVGDESRTYHVDQAREGARQFTADIGRDLLAGVDVEYESVGAVGSKSEEILRAVEEYDCDHVFIAGRKRSPTGKAIFGDTAQQVILNANQPVTIVTE